MKKFILSFALLLAFALPSYSEWNFKLLWERKSYESQFNSQGFQVSKLNPNDSTILTISWDAGTDNRYSIFKFNAFSGEVIKYYLNEDSIANLEYSKDGSYLSVSSNNFLGFVDSANLQYTLKINYPGISGRYHFNEDKKVLTGFTSNTIRLFNSQNGELLKEYLPSYFTPSNLVIQKVALSNVDNKLIYNFKYKVFIGPQPDKYDYYNLLIIIDTNGKVIYEANTKNLMSSNCSWTLSNDGTKIAYFNSNSKIHIFDLAIMKVIGEVNTINNEPFSLKFSKDDKIVYVGYMNGLYYFNLIDLQTQLALPNGTFENYFFDNKISKMFFMLTGDLNSYNISLKSDVTNNIPINLFAIISSSTQDSIEMRFDLISSYLLKANIYDINGKLISQLENKNFETGIYIKNYNIANLPNGAYFIQIKLNDENFPQVLRFVKSGK